MPTLRNDDDADAVADNDDFVDCADTHRNGLKTVTNCAVVCLRFSNTTSGGRGRGQRRRFC